MKARSHFTSPVLCFARLTAWTCLALGVSRPLLAQAPVPPAHDTDSGSILTLNVQSRLVAEDILVTDAQGRPVHSLPQSAFHVFDNGKPQVIRSFEEGAPEAADPKPHPAAPLPPGVFSNVDTADTHTASEVLLVDTDEMVLDDQLYLLAQLKVAVDALPPNLPAALFCSTNGRPVQLRGLTTDHQDLRRALSECLPVLNHAIDDHLASATEQLLTVSAFLQQAPGRKNILWFFGNFPLSLVSANEQRPGGINPDFVTRQHFVRLVEEALAEARVSVYPVDVRGVITSTLPTPATSAGAQSLARNPSSTMQRTPVVVGPPADGPVEQRQQMSQLASSTGGKAYMLNNIADEVGDAFDLGTHSYALTYLPSDYATDESWHRITVTVDGGYHLSYRNGYLATWSGIPGGRQGFRLEDGRRVSTRLDRGGSVSQPLRFTVKVEPLVDAGQSVAKKGRLRVALNFRIATNQVAFVHREDRWRSELFVSSYAYNADGKVRGGRLNELDTALTEEQWQRAQRQEIPLQQVVDIPSDAGYLLLAVRDKRSQRIGTFLLSMRAVRALPPVTNAPTSTAAASARESPVSPTQ